MATITGTNIIDRAAIVLQDTTGVRWPQTDELLLWLNDGQREVVLRKPEAYAQNEVVELVNGTKQSVPAAGIQLLDVIRNMGTDGATPGRAITRIDRQILDEQRPDWHTETADTQTKHYMFDTRDPKHFYVYPPQDDPPGQVELVYASAPTDLDSLGSTITLDDVYAGVLLDYILYRAYSKDADLSPSAPQRAVAHYNSFLASLGAKGQIDQAINPNAYDYQEAVQAQQVGRSQ
ncbi:MAG: DUF6682 family protein [Desulfobacteraceae bacterium]